MKLANKDANRDLILNGNMYRAIFSIAVPVMINSFLQTMYNLVDTYWLGQIGTKQLAAINLVSPVQNIIINFGNGITVAGSVLIAQFIGAGLKKDAKSMANQIFKCAMIFALCCAAVCFVLTGGIVSWLGASGETAHHAEVYLRTVIWDMPFLFMVNIFSAVHQAQGDTVRPMFLNFGGICLNMLLDPLFMIVLGWNTFGAAIATVLAKAVPATIAFILLLNRNNAVCLDRSYMHIEKEKLKTILSIGLPTAIGGSTMQLGFLLMSRNVYVYGDAAMAAYGIGNKVNSLITLPVTGVGSSVATIVGQNTGARKLDRAELGYRLSMRMSMAFLFVGGMILSRPFISTAIVSIFSKEPEVVGMAADFLSIMAFWCFTNGIYNTTSGLFQGTGHTEVTMTIDATRLWVFRFLTLWFCGSILHMGVRSVWYSVVVSNGISAVILYVLYRTGLWRKPRIKIEGKDEEKQLKDKKTDNNGYRSNALHRTA
ncbi:MAG: MATE family efflux transporter [Lachnospiraceae bacterium]|nr:MATE family efflux transporter [Lachnospiraceae bacterium]